MIGNRKAACRTRAVAIERVTSDRAWGSNPAHGPSANGALAPFYTDVVPTLMVIADDRSRSSLHHRVFFTTPSSNRAS